LSVYVHTPGKGWWYKQVSVNVSATAPTAAPVSAAPAPTVSAGGPPILAVEQPTSGSNISTKNPFEIVGYALDTAAAPNQGSQGSGIDSVTVYIDAEPQNGGTFVGNADLAFSDLTAQSKYGPQFANSGWRLTFKPTNFHSGGHQLFIYAHSVVTGQTALVTQNFNITES
jgi:hypothetical protein